MNFSALHRLSHINIVLLLLFSLSLASADSSADVDHEGMTSPLGATIRSSFVPGWGQFITGGKIKGVVSFVATYGMIVGSFVARSRYLDVYKNQYEPAVLSDSPEADYYYDIANQRYKLSRGLLFTAAGIWLYSMIDSYVSSSIRNAEIMANALEFDTSRIDAFDIEYRALEGEVRVKSTIEF